MTILFLATQAVVTFTKSQLCASVNFATILQQRSMTTPYTPKEFF
jgi:hypothetical protein